jgi:hypothetical protein
VKRFAILVLLTVGAMSALPTSQAAWLDTTQAAVSVSADRPIRVTTYEIGLDEFTGTDFMLKLDQDLARDYFVMIRGSAGDGQVTSRPSSDSVRVVRDPYILGPSTRPNELALYRETATMQRDGTADWRGSIIVVESLDRQDTDGFVLKDIVSLTLTAGNPTGAASVRDSFDQQQTVPYGGVRGGGVATTATGNREYRAQWARFWLTGSDTVRAEGSGIPVGATATYTIYVVQWGSNWLIQHAFVNGNESGNGIDSLAEYTSENIPIPVARENTWVIGYGHTSSGSLGAGWQGQVFTLGDGVSQNATESQVSVGAERSGSRTADLYVQTHPRLKVAYVFGVDGSIGAAQATGAVATAPPAGPENRVGGGVATTAGTRLAVFANSSNGQGRQYPRPIFWARHESDTAIVWQRARTGQRGAYWVQSVDFGEIWR